MTDSKEIDDGGPAFPDTYTDRGWMENKDGVFVEVIPRPGMSLRDWFAGQALIGILSGRNGFLIDVGTESAPKWAYEVADNMLSARSTPEVRK